MSSEAKPRRNSMMCQVYIDPRILADLILLYDAQRLHVPPSFSGMIREIVYTLHEASVPEGHRVTELDTALEILDAHGLRTKQPNRTSSRNLLNALNDEARKRLNKEPNTLPKDERAIRDQERAALLVQKLLREQDTNESE